METARRRKRMTERGGRSATPDAIRITTYEDWMREQTVSLFCEQYGRDREREESHFVRFYEHPFQRERGIRLVALDGDRVVGFQSFFYWPYCQGERRFETFQSGSSLVGAAYRGKGIFGRLLRHLDELRQTRRIDFLMGFPVEMSYRSFIRDGWANPLDLSWYARVIHPLSVASTVDLATVDTGFETRAEKIEVWHPADAWSLSKEPDFEDWRGAYGVDSNHLFLHHREHGGDVRFALKLNRRGRIVELMVGDIVVSDPNPELLRGALRALVKRVRAHRFVTILTVALNRAFVADGLVHALKRRLFFRLRPEIHFIVKDLGGQHPGVTDPRRWRLLRSDIDTW
jgi:GNAT superfamily N-acetyltransferase